MLISHRKNFIFTKTAKTAGTTVESYFERWCMHPGEWVRLEGRPAHVDDAGIIGARGPDAKSFEWYNHMGASEIKRKIGEDIWESYHKFTVVRNPFDKLVSRFYMLANKQITPEGRRGTSGSDGFFLGAEDQIKAFRSWLKGEVDPILRTTGSG